MSSGAELFGRVYSCVVAPVGGSDILLASEGLDVSNLRIAFKVKKTLKPQPNTADIRIYNLGPDSRRLLEKASKLVVRLEAGYEDTGTSQLYLGEVRNAITTWDGAGTCETQITTGDGEKEMREARIHISIGAAVPPTVALMAIARALKVGEGNVAQAAQTLASKGVVLFGPGTAISGNAATELTDFCRSAGLEWSIQDGQLQILDRNKALEDRAIELSPETGLVGSPTFDFNGASKQQKGGLLVKATSLLIPELTPGRKVAFKSRDVSGGYRIEEVEYVGDSHGLDWYAHLVCRAY